MAGGNAIPHVREANVISVVGKLGDNVKGADEFIHRPPVWNAIRSWRSTHEVVARSLASQLNYGRTISWRPSSRLQLACSFVSPRPHPLPGRRGSRARAALFQMPPGRTEC